MPLITSMEEIDRIFNEFEGKHNFLLDVYIDRREQAARAIRKTAESTRSGHKKIGITNIFNGGMGFAGGMGITAAAAAGELSYLVGLGAAAATRTIRRRENPRSSSFYVCTI